jgi:hypothetical protein
MLISSYPILTPINPFVEQMTTIDEYTQQTFKDITESLKMLLTFVDNQDIQTIKDNFKTSNLGTVYWIDVVNNASSYYIEERLKIEVSKWGNTKQIFKNNASVFTNCHSKTMTMKMVIMSF